MNAPGPTAFAPDTAPVRPWVWLALAMVITPALIHAGIGYDPFPDWSSDPTVMYTPRTTLGPAESVGLSIAALAGCVILIMGGAARVARLTAVPACLVAAYAMLHARGPEGFAIGAAWSAAIMSAVTFASLHDQRLRRAALAALAGSIFLLVSKGAYQVFVEHPRTLASFHETREAFLASQGWSEDSIMARSFERRLKQAEASGWFGLANVFATICAGMLALFACSAIGAWRSPVSEPQRRWARVVFTAGAAAAVLGVVLAGGKGGYAAAALGLGLVLIISFTPARFAPKLQRVGPYIGTGAVALALSAVALRGIVGLRLGELSLLFRWFYVKGAINIFRHEPAGVGPDGFKDAYMLYKPPLSPEEVTSPHSVFFDYLATLGVAGIAWIALVVWLLLRVGRSLVSHESNAIRDPDSARETIRFVGLVSAVAMLAAVYIERPIVTPATMVLRLAGVLFAAATAIAVVRAPERSLRIGAAAAAIAMLTHGQIEVTPVWIGSAALVFSMLGLAAANAPRRHDADPEPERPTRRYISAGLAAVPALTAIWFAVPVWRWQHQLGQAAAHVGAATDLKQRLDAVAARNPLFIGDTQEQIARDAAALAGAAPANSTAQLRSMIAGLIVRRAVDCTERFSRAERVLADADLYSSETARTAERLWLLIASIQTQDPTVRKAMSVDAIAKIREMATMEVADSQGGRNSRRTRTLGVSEWSAGGTFRRAAAQITGDKSLLVPAIKCFAQAAALDPFGLTYPLEVYQTAGQLGDTRLQAVWAAKCLEMDLLTRLDPLRGLTERQRQEMTRIAPQVPR